MSGVRLNAPVARPRLRLFASSGLRDTDPVATATSRPLAGLASVTAFVVATVLTIDHPGIVERPALMIISFVFLAASCVTLVKGASSLRRSFTLREHIAVVLLSWAAALCEAAAQWPHNEYLRDDWGPYVVAIVLVATTPYRPVASLMVALGGSVVFVGSVAALQSPAMVTDAPVAAFALLAAAPVTLLAGAGIAFVRAELLKGEASSQRGTASIDRDRPITLTAQERRVHLLTTDVAPLFSWVVRRGTITSQDVVRAAEISDAVRATMVYAANQTWVGRAVQDAIEGATLVPTRTSPSERRYMGRMLAESRVADATNLSGQMTFEQRTVIRALLRAIFEHDQIRPETFAARVVSHDATAQLWIDVSFGGGHPAQIAPSVVDVSSRASWDSSLPRVRARDVRSVLAPFLAVARDGFVAVEFTSYSTEQSVKVTLRFSYGL